MGQSRHLAPCGSTKQHYRARSMTRKASHEGSITPLMIPTPWVYGIGFAFRDTQTKFPFVSEQLFDWGGRPTFLVLTPSAVSSSRVRNSMSFVFDTRSIPKDSRLEGGKPWRLMKRWKEAEDINQKTRTKKEMSGKQQKMGKVWFRDVLIDGTVRASWVSLACVGSRRILMRWAA